MCNMSETNYSYDLKTVVPLHHLPKTVVAISAMTGPSTSGKKQYFINTSYLLGKEKRNGPKDVGMRRTKGFSIQASDIPALCDALTSIARGEADDTHLFACYACTEAEGKMIFHRRRSADAPEACPRQSPDTTGSDAYSIE